MMGRLYSEHKGTISTPGTALSWYRKAAEQGEPAGDFKVAETLLKSDSCDFEEIEEALARYKVNYIRTMNERFPKSTQDYGESADTLTKQAREKISALKVTCDA